MNKFVWYPFHNPALSARTALGIARTKMAKFDETMIHASVRGSNGRKIVWLNDFKCSGCNRFIAQRYCAGEMARHAEDCSTCAEWLSPQGQAILQTALKGNYLRSGDPEVEDVIRKHLKPGDTFADIGGCIGYFSALGAAIVGDSGRVVAFEPMPIFYENWDRLLALNPGVPVVLERAAMSDRDGSAVLRMPLHFHVSSNFIAESGGEGEDRLVELSDLTVKTVSFRSYFAGQRVDFCKIDVEGHELKVLRDIVASVEQGAIQGKPHIVYEHEACNYGASELAELEAVNRRFGAIGYRVLYAGTSSDATRMDAFTGRAHIHLAPR
jgi:FkbM family methyltransferase